MKKLSAPLRIHLVALAMISALLYVPNTSAQTRSRSNQTTQTLRASQSQKAYQNGYPAGYRDGYGVGKEDYLKRSNRDFRNDDRYRNADRGYRSYYGTQADYQAGYRLGYEMGYVDGFYGRIYTTRLPQNALALRNVTPDNTSAAVGRVFIPNGTKLTLRLNSIINTKTNRQGDRFTASVINPRQYEYATVAGHIARLDRSGRLTGKTELQLAFDTITLRNGRTGALEADVREIIASDNVKSVDEEGNVETSNKTRDTTIRTGGGAALGAIIGAIAGGGKGAAIGALLGAGVGAGSVYIQGNKDLILDPGTEIIVETAAPQNSNIRR